MADFVSRNRSVRWWPDGSAYVGGIERGGAVLAPLTQRLALLYRRVFSVDEIYDDIVLKFFSGAILIGFHVTFASWIYSPLSTVRAVTQNFHVCWPMFQNCQVLIWLSTLPDGYSQTTVYMGLFGLMVLCGYFMLQGRWTGVHVVIGLLFLAKMYFTSINYVENKGNYDYYHNAYCIIFLLLPHKKFFSQLAVVLFYFMSTASKIHPSWILGQYFTAMADGLPIFPMGSEIFMTNLVIVMEMFGAWFLFSKNRLVQRSVFLFFVVFHLYSGILVGFRYPTTVLPALLILFGPWFEAPKKVPLDRRAIPGWSLVGVLLVAQLLPHMIEGDEKLTLEGNFFGLYMFEANHQCFGTIKSGERVVRNFNSTNPRLRCDPYEYWFRAKNTFCRSPGQAYSFQMNHSINGGPFYRIIDEPDLCKLEYKAFSHNAWIKTEKEAAMIGRPAKNSYR